MENGREIVLTFREKLKQTKIFTETEKELTFKFKKKLSETQITDLVKILVELADSVETNGGKVKRTD